MKIDAQTQDELARIFARGAPRLFLSGRLEIVKKDEDIPQKQLDIAGKSRLHAHAKINSGGKA